jgi:hypothetical protein
VTVIRNDHPPVCGRGATLKKGPQTQTRPQLQRLGEARHGTRRSGPSAFYSYIFIPQYGHATALLRCCCTIAISTRYYQALSYTNTVAAR